jgi:hypothetical protein
MLGLKQLHKLLLTPHIHQNLKELSLWVSHLYVVQFQLFQLMWDIYSHLIDINIFPQVWASLRPWSITTHVSLPEPDSNTTDGPRGEYHRVGSTHWTLSNHTTDFWYQTFGQNLKTLSLWIFSLYVIQSQLFLLMWDFLHTW